MTYNCHNVIVLRSGVSGKAITEDTIIKEIKLHNEKKKTKKKTKKGNLNGGEKERRVKERCQILGK